LKQRFKLQRVVMVGDRGADQRADEQTAPGWPDWITALRVKQLAAEGRCALAVDDRDIAESPDYPGERLVVQEPLLAEELAAKRGTVGRHRRSSRSLWYACSGRAARRCGDRPGGRCSAGTAPTNISDQHHRRYLQLRPKPLSIAAEADGIYGSACRPHNPMRRSRCAYKISSSTPSAR
jgi:hypothetical protein